MAVSMLEKLKVARENGKKGLKMPLVWTETEKKAFEALKGALLGMLSLQVINPAWSFRLRTDASGFAIAAVLE